LEEHSLVTDAGDLPLILGGSVMVAHLTPAQAGTAIEDALRRGHFLLTPRVLVTFESNETQNVSVLGEVRQPGAYPIDTPRSILDVLALAGGLTDIADRQVLLLRQGTSEKVSYYLSNAPVEAFDNAVLVYPGDKIIVPKAGIVYILGDVAHPGGYTMTETRAQISALQLLSRAGGTNHTANPSHAKLIRRLGNAFSEIQLPLSAMQTGRVADLQLQADDIVYVPFSYLRNFAVGAGSIAASVGSAAVYRF